MTEEEWRAISSYDRGYDEKLVFVLRNGTTYCRPSCHQKQRKPERMLVFPSASAAQEAGFVPCRFCRPDQKEWKGAKADLTEQARKYLEAHYHEKFSLKVLSDTLHVDGSYLLRTFRAQTGHTLLWYHQHLRCREAKYLLSEPEKSVAEIGAAVGFSTSALFSRVFKQMEGVTPSAYREKTIGDRFTY